MNNWIENTKHYTDNYQYICGNLVNYIPKDVQLIEPFVGQGALLNLFSGHSWEYHDIVDNNINIVRDTLLNPPDYHNK